jgi:hypothetical protein
MEEELEQVQEQRRGKGKTERNGSGWTKGLYRVLYSPGWYNKPWLKVHL